MIDAVGIQQAERRGLLQHADVLEVPTTGVRAAQPKHMPELDGIRGLAILGVLLSHGAGLTGIFDGMNGSVAAILFRLTMIPLWGGVDLFFVLSGFLITGILLKTKDSPHYFSSFYARRILRIFPIYYLTLISTLIAAHFLFLIHTLLPPTTLWKVAYFVYLQNWPGFWHGQGMLSGIWGAYWSLAVEEQFYIVWPLFVWLFSGRALQRLCIFGIICALPLRILLSVYAFGASFGLAQLTGSRIDGLLAGAACALYMAREQRPLPIGMIKALGLTGAAIMCYIATFHTIELIRTNQWIMTLGITGFVLLSTALVALSQHHTAPAQRLLSSKVLQTAGKYSYGMYVYHTLVFLPFSFYVKSDAGAWTRSNFGIGVLFMLFEFSLVFLIAKLSYDLLEVRFLRLKMHFKPA
ncbi:MAG TPA: acyltransferase [Terracidiphilus sp.]|nr:acyltransferase [Terracidiphilus sp.]